MACLALGKGLFPSIRTWKSFTTNLFQKLRPRKMIKIAKTRRPKTRAPPPAMYYPPLPSEKKQSRRRIKERRQLFCMSKALHRPKRQLHFKKQSSQAPPPVFVDELFWSRTGEGGGLAGCSMPAKGKAEPATSSAVLRVNQLQTVPETGVHSTCSGDEMWESVGLGLPQMRGIDARAEEFITRFRAELEFQEIVAHRLWHKIV